VKRIVVIVVFALIAVAGVVAIANAVFQPVEVVTQPVTSGDAKETVYATGHVEARERRTIRAQRSAIIDQKLVSSMILKWRAIGSRSIFWSIL